jgi:hypothetical protein
MTHHVGDEVRFDDSEFVITQITQRAKDSSLKVVLQEVVAPNE